jgi:alpha-D-ribose 1-methylphosphonate 5-triphosphate synthase subunit PhnH
MPALAQDLLPGLADPVFDSQRVFRAVLDAMSHPGRVHTVELTLQAPAPLTPLAAAIALTLADFETTLWVQASQNAEAVARYLRFHCGSPLATATAAARFAMIHDASGMPALSAFAMGAAEYPDRSCTLIVQVASLDSGTPVRLRGPGIRDEAKLAVAGLPARFWQEWRDNTAQFPLGVDVILVADRKIAALVRTTQVELA